MFYAMVVDANGVGIGAHAYGERPVALPDNEVACTQEQAANPTKFVAENGVVVQTTTAQVQGKVDELRDACKAAILGGYVSSALGTPHTYPSLLEDQMNLIGAVTDSLTASAGWTVEFWCADTQGVWALRSHTASEIQGVMRDAKAVRVGYSVKLDQLCNAARAAAGDSAALNAIKW